MNRILQTQTTTTAILQKKTLINFGILASLMLVFMLSATTSFATCYGNVTNGGEIGSDQTICAGESATLTNEASPTGGVGTLEYMWLSNTVEPSFTGSTGYPTSYATFNTGDLTETTWFRRCSRRDGCSSWDYGESNWIKITVGNAVLEHVDGVNETACDANDGKIITDPFINQGTALPYSVEYTYDGQVYSDGPYATNEDHYITGLAPGVYSNITVTDANGCSSVWGNDITIAEFTTGCTPPTVVNTCELLNHGPSNTNSNQTRLLWLNIDGQGVKEYSLIEASSVIDYSDGSSVITGYAEQVDNTCNKWSYSIRLINKRTWAQWSALGRSYKSGGTGDHTTWDYYELDNYNSTFTGINCLEGKTLNLTHNPSSYEFGFQVGNGANDMDGDYGFSGWYAFTGSFTGHGDFNGDLANCAAPTSPSIVKTCNLLDHGLGTFNTTEERLIYFNVDGDIKEYSVAGTSTIVEYSDGSAVITGTAEQVDNTCNKWEYSVRLINKRTWAQWSALDRSYKAGGTGDHTTWDYYELDNYNSTFTGVDCLSGELVNLTHNPGDYEFGFQVGNGANDKDADFGLSGWFSFTGSYTGNGDFNGDVDCGSSNTCTGIIDGIILTNGSESVTLQDGGTYQLCDLPSNNYLEAVVSGNHESFFFNVNGDTRNENVVAYNYPSVSNGNTWDPQVGAYTINGTLYPENNSDGLACDQVTLNINIVDCLPVCTKYRVTDSDPECSSAFNGAGTGVFFRRDCGETFETWKAGSDLILEELGNGNATLSGSIYNGNTIGQVNLNLEGYSSTGQNWTNQCYNDNMTTEYFYTGFNGTVTIGSDIYTLIQKNGVDVVLGLGANNQSDNQFGFGAWFDGTWGNCIEAFGKLTPILPGETCDDSNPITDNDVILTDGCTCEGTTTSIGDFVFNDLNGNGIQETGEFGLPGVTVMLLDEDGNMVDQVQTDADGKYIFTNIATGQYKVKFPATGSAADLTYILTQPNQGSNDNVDSDPAVMQGTNDAMTDVFTVNEGDEITDIDAGYFIGSKLTGVTWEDTNANGIQDANEPNIDGVVIMLLDQDGNMVAQTTTSGNGVYTFDNLAPGDYKVKFPIDTNIASTDFTLTTPNQGGNDDIDSDAVPMTDGSGNSMTQIVTVSNGQTVNNLDAGYYAPAKLGNKVFEDTNGNGIQDTDEPGIAGVTVMLLDEDGVMIDSKITNANGIYKFIDLVPGTYKIKFPIDATIAGNDFTLTTPDQGTNDNLDSDAVPMSDGSGNAMSEFVTLESGDNNNSVDAGYYIPASLGNYVFNDKNQDGIQNGDDTGIDGIIVMLLDADGNMVAQTTTVDGGYYEFSDLVPSTYKVKFPSSISNEITLYEDCDYAGTELQLGVGEYPNISNLGFSNDALSSIKIPTGLKVTLYQHYDFGGTSIELTADDNCLTNFNEIVSSLKIEEISDPVNPYILTLENNGGDDNLDSDAVPMNDGSGNAMSQLVDLKSGDTNETVDAGYIELAKIGDRVFQDVNENGIQDNDDIAYTDVNIMLFGTDIFGNTINETTTTDEDGFYEFANVVPGDYELKFTSNQIAFIPTVKDFSSNGFDEVDSDIYQTSGRTDVITVNTGDVNITIDAGFIFDASLPVQLISFEAQLVNGSQVLLKWATASEINNRHFVVERSVDGNDFRPIGLVEGNGTTNLVNHYSLDDTDPFYGANYYRLKQVDYNGDSEYSQIETVIVSGDDIPDVIVYPNPVIHTTTLRVVTPFETDAQIEIISQSGKIIKVITMEAGSNSKQLDLSDYTAGIYYAYINYNGHRTLVHNIVKVDE